MSSQKNNIPTKRIFLILDYLEDLLKNNPGKSTFSVQFEKIAKKDLILQDSQSIDRAFKSIEEKTGGSITYTSTFIPTGKIIPSSPDSINNQMGVSLTHVYIDDPAEIDKLRKDMLKHPESNKRLVDLILMHKDNQAIISIKGGDSDITCFFSIAPRRYKILRHIIDTQDYVSTKVLESKFKISAKEVRKEIKAIRDRLSKDLKINKDNIIETSLDDKGYRFLNIDIQN